MKNKPAEFSETGFAFAFMAELVNLWGAHVVGAPEFPTQRREGKPGGGWDARLKSSLGFVYFIQFKSSEYCENPKTDNADYGLPFYRFTPRTKTGEPNQHELLRSLESAGNLVEYVAPCFHTFDDYERFFVRGEILSSVRRLRPSRLGEIKSGEHHRVQFRIDGSDPALYSQPMFIDDPDYGSFNADGFATRSSTAENIAADSTMASQTSYAPGSLAHQLDFALRQIAETFGVTSVLGQIDSDDPLVRVRTLARALLGADVLVVSAPPESYDHNGASA